MSFFLLVIHVVSGFCMSYLRLFCLCCEWLVCRKFSGSFGGYKKSGIGALALGYLFTRVLFEFQTFWRHGDDMLRQSGRGFKAGKKVISKRFAHLI